MPTTIDHARSVAKAVATFFGGKIVSIEVTEAKKRADYDHWVAEAKEKGYKPGWASFRYKDNYGGWPPQEWQDAGGTGGSTWAAKTHQGAPKPKAVVFATCPRCGYKDGLPLVPPKAPPEQDEIPF